ncbi:MAG: hypothetical protein JXJ20_06575 [Anaerolineae bacterium]|nr:hypothetical protein [Anaerolineae bacterium]
MTTIPADHFEIAIVDGDWQLIPTGDELLSRPVFHATHGAGVMEYTPAFGQAHRLPGTVLSIEYVQAVVIGYQEESRRWLLGFQIARSAADKGRWLELVHWPPGDNEIYEAAARQAGRILAEYVGCPLKIFGAKKPPRSPGDTHGVTGPLVPHKREDIGPQQVRLLARSIHLPLQYPHIWLGHGRTGLALRLAKEATTDIQGGIAPAFNQCSIDPEQSSIRLLPPTGLLGAFLGGQRGRELKISDVRNVELRHTILHRSMAAQDAGGFAIDVTYTMHTWGVFLTLPDESLLLAQTTHSTSSELSRRRTMAGNKFSVDSESGIEYLRQHQADQEAYDTAASWAESAALVIAGTLGTRLVKTEASQESV